MSKIKTDDLPVLKPLDQDTAEQARGGASRHEPGPAGPVPVPYPTFGAKVSGQEQDELAEASQLDRAAIAWPSR